MGKLFIVRNLSLAPQVGLEPTTLRLTAECSTIELLRSNGVGIKLANMEAECQCIVPAFSPNTRENHGH
jgi:hypothetical protein